MARVTNNNIPNSLPWISEDDIARVSSALRSGQLVGGGPQSDAVRRTLEVETGAARVILTNSGTTALEMASMLLSIEPGDTVIAPSFAFSSTVNAFIRSGAKVKFADIETQTLGLDPNSVGDLMDDSVRAVVPIHYAGTPCDIDGLAGVVATRERVSIVEDNAHGLFARFQDQPLGTFGPLGATSFHGTKNITSAEGGALFVNDPDLVDRAEIMSEKGTDRSAFLAGEVDKYTWRDIGGSCLMADPLAGLLLSQLERREEINQRRQNIFATYVEILSPVAADLGLTLPSDRAGSRPVRHLFHTLVDDPTIRDDVVGRLREAGIGASFHFLPLHRAPAARIYGDGEFDCPVTDSVSSRLIRLPLFPLMTESDTERCAGELISAVKDLT